ncbi:MAG: ATP-binding protein [Spirochaetaceae bacterium]|nr:MAG: ATP-binding protein [Spirochaetaceae bacterium]
MDLAKFYKLDIVLVCGLPGSGKSQFAAQFFADTGRDRVNRKEIHRLLYEMIHFGKKWTEKEFDALDDFLVKHVERKIIEHLLQNSQKILVDNTSVSESSRKTYLGIAHQMHKSIGAIFLHTPPATCLQRNRSREDPVPERVISNLAAEIDLPRSEEGFREVLILKDY